MASQGRKGLGRVPAFPLLSTTTDRPVRSRGLEAIFVAAPIPPPYEPPLAPVAPDKLTRFLYYMTRDFIPLGVIEHALERTRSDTDKLPSGPHTEYCERTARELVYEETPVAP